MSANDQNKVYVGNLAYDVDEELLRKEFEQFGEIVSIKIIVDQEGQSLGYAFVTYATLDGANGAMDGMHGRVIAGRTIKVNDVKPKGGKNNRDSSYRDRSDRDHRDRSGRDRDKDRSNRFSPRRTKHSRGRDRSPEYHKKRSPRNDRSRSSRSRSHSTDSYDTRDPIKTLKSGGVDNTRLKEDLLKAFESQKSSMDQLSSLEDDLKHARSVIEEQRSKEKKLESDFTKASAKLSQNLQHFRKVQRAFLDIRECKEKLKNAELDFQELLINVSLDVPDITMPLLANGDMNHTDESKRKFP